MILEWHARVLRAMAFLKRGSDEDGRDDEHVPHTGCLFYSTCCAM